MIPPPDQPFSEIIRRVCQLGSVFALVFRLEPWLLTQSYKGMKLQLQSIACHSWLWLDRFKKEVCISLSAAMVPFIQSCSETLPFAPISNFIALHVSRRQRRKDLGCQLQAVFK